MTERRDHPGPPVRELTTDLSPEQTQADMRVLVEKKKKTHTEAKMKRQSERFTSLAAGLFSLRTPPHRELLFHDGSIRAGRGYTGSEMKMETELKGGGEGEECKTVEREEK